MDLCDICKNIRFDDLPSEDEPGIPHQPDLDSLEESAEDCCVCRVIFLAASELSTIIHNERIGNGGNAGGEVVYRAVDGKYNVTDFGYNSTDVDGIFGGGPVGYTGPVYTDPQEVFPDEPDLRPWLFGSWYLLDKLGSDPQLVGLGVRLGTGPRAEDAVGNPDDKIRLRGTSFRFRTMHDSPVEAIVPGRLRATDSSSEIAFTRIEGWLKRCNECHSCLPKATALPTRVLDLGECTQSQVITLVDGQNHDGKYVALSHCWGDSHRIKTLKDTVDDFRKGIPFSKLPQTFQDAVVATRRFNIRYLWIDTLCIIQDDPLDWEMESSKMGDVYANAYLTIAASNSTDDSTGLYPDMDDRMDCDENGYRSSDAISHGRPGPGNVIPDAHIKKGAKTPMFATSSDTAFFSFTTKSGETALMFLSPEWMPSSTKTDPLKYKIGEFGKSFDPLGPEPLSARAWTLQERLLSPRILHYGINQMFWECRECVLAEDGAIFEPSCRELPTFRQLPLRDPTDMMNKVNLTEQDSRAALSTLSSKPWPPQQWRSAWTSLIEEYSTRALTCEEDKFSALAGLARNVSACSGEIYIAGFWKSSLLESLSWRVAVNEPDHMCGDPAHDALLSRPWKSRVRVPVRYRAPSWSWASIDAQIEYQIGLFDKCTAELVDCMVEPADTDPFGRLRGGWIKISASLLPLSLDERTAMSLNRKKFPFRTPVTVSLSHDVIRGTAYFDLEPSFPCSALFLSKIYALIVQKVEGEKTYKRIGAVQFYALGGYTTGVSSDIAATLLKRQERKGGQGLYISVGTPSRAEAAEEVLGPFQRETVTIV